MSKRIPPRLEGGPARAGSVCWRLGAFELDELRRELRRDGRQIAIEPKPLNLLMLLARHPGELITKDELIDRLWGGRVVSDTVIARCVSKLRAALAEQEEWIHNVHGYGYRYDGPVQPLAATDPSVGGSKLDIGGPVPGRPDWALQARLGDRGETWLARQASGEQRVFKIALDGTGLTALKREAAVYRLIAETASADINASGEAPALRTVPLLGENLRAPPFYLELGYCKAGNLEQWLQRRGRRLEVGDCVALIAQLATQVSALHLLGVLHRDIKPTNVLILDASDRNRPILALADFGSGGVTDRDRLRQLGITRTGLAEGATDTTAGATLLYLAPEVAAGQPFTSQADIYALGVMFYQLLVHDLRRPLAPGWEREVDDALLRADIAAACDQSPSHRLTNAAELGRRLLSLDRRREEAAIATAARAEAARLRQNERRARQRRRVQVAVITALSIGLALSGVLFLKARQARQVAEASSALAQSVTRFLDESVLGAADPYRAGGGRNVTVASLLDTAVRDFGRLDHQPALQLALGTTLAGAYHNLGLEPQARNVALLALQSAERGGLSPNDAAVNKLRAKAAWIEIDLARYDDAAGRFAEMLAHSDTAATRREARYGLARLAFEQGHYAESAAGYQALLREAAADRPGTVDESLIADLRWDLAETDFELPNWEEAGALLSKVRDYYRQQNPPPTARLLWLSVSDAYRLQMLEQFDEARELLEATHRTAATELGETHPIAMSAIHLLAVIRIKQGQAAEALPLLETVLAWRQQHYGTSHYLTRSSLGRKGEALTLLGRPAEAEPLLRHSWQESVAALGSSHPHSLDLERLLAECLAASGHGPEAEAHFKAVLQQGSERLGQRNNRLTWARYGLGRLLKQQHRDPEAEVLLRDAAEDFRINFGEHHRMIRTIEQLLGGQPLAIGGGRLS